MPNKASEDLISSIVYKLYRQSNDKFLSHSSSRNMSMPSIFALNELMLHLKKVLFPGYFGNSDVNGSTINYYLGANIDLAFRTILEQIKRGFCFDCNDENKICSECEINASQIASNFISLLPQIQQKLSTDVIAAYKGDPAAKNYGEVIFCYPSIVAMTHYRIAHELSKLNVPIIPRIISEMAHSLTGIDIHPGAQIDEYFFIDHGTGVVIGETSVIGKNVRLYQGVTLGAKSFPLDENGRPIKGIPRHPIVEDDVIIYSNSTILGRVTIGKGAVIGGNMWVTEDVKSGEKILQHRNN